MQLSTCDSLIRDGEAGDKHETLQWHDQVKTRRNWSQTTLNWHGHPSRIIEKVDQIPRREPSHRLKLRKVYARKGLSTSNDRQPLRDDSSQSSQEENPQPEYTGSEYTCLSPVLPQEKAHQLGLEPVRQLQIISSKIKSAHD